MLYITIHDVLFATDFSDASRLAGETAAEFARHFGARLHVLHVVPPVTDPTPATTSAVAVPLTIDVPRKTTLRASAG